MMPLRQSADFEVGIAAVSDIAPRAWDDLSLRAGPTHPFFGRRVLSAHAEAGLLPSDLRVLTVSSGVGLEALLPFRLRRDLSGLGGLVARPFLTPYVTSTEPLVAQGDERSRVMTTLVAGLSAASGGRAWRWPLLAVGGRNGTDLLQALSAAGWRHGAVMEFERPVLDRRASQEAFLEGHPSRSRFKDLRRRARRLAEIGRVEVESATEGPRLRALVDAFLRLERAGWKGEAGTALACAPETTALAHGLFASSDGGPVGTRADAILLDGRPVAISLALTGGGVTTLLKTAFDEDLRSHAPGLLLEVEIVRLCHETAFADRLDSATLPNSALEGLYRDRETVAEIVAVPPGAEALSLERRLRLAQFEARGRETAKRVLPAMLRRGGSRAAPPPA